MNIHATTNRYVENRPGKQQSVGRDDNEVRFGPRNLRNNIGIFQRLRLPDRNVMLDRELLDRTFRHLSATPGRPIRLCQYGRRYEACLVQRPQ